MLRIVRAISAQLKFLVWNGLAQTQNPAKAFILKEISAQLHKNFIFHLKSMTVFKQLFVG